MMSETIESLAAKNAKVDPEQFERWKEALKVRRAEGREGADYDLALPQGQRVRRLVESTQPEALPRR